MKILQDKDNFLTNRKEVKVIVEAEKNPSYEDAEKVISKQFNVKENIVVKKVKGKFGRKTFLISAFIYNSNEDKERFEPKDKKEEQEKEQQKEVKKEVKEDKKEEQENKKAEKKEEKPKKNIKEEEKK